MNEYVIYVAIAVISMSAMIQNKLGDVHSFCFDPICKQNLFFFPPQSILIGLSAHVNLKDCFLLIGYCWSLDMPTFIKYNVNFLIVTK